MNIITSQAQLIAKKQLTHDVFELTFSFPQEIHVLPGQFFTFRLPDCVSRAYSVAKSSGTEVTFLIKRIPQGQGSPLICDLPIGENLTLMGPAGRFLLEQNTTPKLFLWTGTGFAPLFFQLTKALEQGKQEKVFLAFGVRFAADLFYADVLQELKNTYSQFDFCFYVSREEVQNTKKWYITECLKKDFVEQFSEFYICGGGAMIQDVREKLHTFWVSPTCIFFEQY